jgi:hypothetical protein
MTNSPMIKTKKRQKMMDSLRVDGNKLQKEPPNSKSPMWSSKSKRMSKMGALATKETQMMLLKLQSSGHNASGPVNRNMISEY